MTVIRAPEGTEYDMHGATFTAFAHAGTGSIGLRAWNLRLPPGQPGVEHRISKEEIFLVCGGTPRIAVDGTETLLGPRDVVVAPAGSLLRVENPGSQEADLWVTTHAGLSAQLADGSTIEPPWAR